jgi:hypothetical protein
MHHNTMEQTRAIGKQFQLKEGSAAVGDPDARLGAKLRKATLKNGVEAWSMSLSKHSQANKPQEMLRTAFWRRRMEGQG